MAYWHETVREKGSVIFHSSKDRVACIFTGYDVRKAPFEGHFLRWEGEGKPDLWGWQRNPADWYVLQPHEPILASSSDEMRAKFESVKSAIADRSLDSVLERKPYVAPAPAKLVKEIAHPESQAKAQIFCVSHNRYLVRYVVFAPEDKYYPASTPSVVVERGWEWGLPRKGNETFADDMANAEEIALVELRDIVAEDPEIKARDRDPAKG